MTQEFLQDAIVEDLEQLFSNYTLTNSLGVSRQKGEERRLFPTACPVDFQTSFSSPKKRAALFSVMRSASEKAIPLIAAIFSKVYLTNAGRLTLPLNGSGVR